MAPLDLAAYLGRIGCPRPLSATGAALRRLHQAHLAAIPFENLDILLGRPILLDLGALQAKLVTGLRGGYCFEQNTLFRAALEAVGFEVTALSARVRLGTDKVRARTHMLLRVDLPEGPFVADVGFGADGFVYPLPLVVGQETWIGASGYRLRREGEQWVLEASLEEAWVDLYAFTLEPQFPVDFEMANHFTSTHPSSSFVRTLTAQRCWPDGRVVLRDRDLLHQEGGRIRRSRVRSPTHLLHVLDHHFGLTFPADTRFMGSGLDF